MTEVQFHFNVPDRLGYACRLLRKATRQGVGVTVTAPPATLTRLDRTLWAFEPTEFVPHVVLRGEGELPPRLRRTPVVLTTQADRGAQHRVLLHLGDEPAEGFESFERLIEIVSADPGERDAARQRWRHYAARGYAIKRHDREGEGGA